MSDRSLKLAMLRGFKSKCPSCGQSSIFSGALTIKDRCEVCGEDFHHHRADDLPAYLNIFIVGHLVIGCAMILMRYDFLTIWQLTFATAAACVFFALLLMRPLKGMVVGNQWALRMHGFGEETNSDQHSQF